jgi:hypothetical protein
MGTVFLSSSSSSSSSSSIPAAPTLEQRAYLKRFVSLQFLNLYKVGRTPWTRDQFVARPLPKTITEKTQRDIHNLSGIRTHNSSVRVGEDISCLRSRGQMDTVPNENEICSPIEAVAGLTVIRALSMHRDRQRAKNYSFVFKEVWNVYFSYWLFNDALSVMSLKDGKVIDAWWIEKDIEGSGRGLIEMLFLHFSGGTEENYQKPHSE